METRIEIPVDREIVIEGAPFDDKKITKAKMIQAVNSIEDDEQVMGMESRSGYSPTWGGGQDDEGIYYCYMVLIARKYRPETDQEYFDRMKNSENIKKSIKEKQRIEFLRLKAIFEPDTPIK